MKMIDPLLDFLRGPLCTHRITTRERAARSASYSGSLGQASRMKPPPDLATQGRSRRGRRHPKTPCQGVTLDLA